MAEKEYSGCGARWGVGCLTGDGEVTVTVGSCEGAETGVKVLVVIGFRAVGGEEGGDAGADTSAIGLKSCEGTMGGETLPAWDGRAGLVACEGTTGATAGLETGVGTKGAVWVTFAAGAGWAEGVGTNGVV